MGETAKTVIVTGISGYVGKWIAHNLLKKGYAVRGTLRNMDKRHKLQDMFRTRLGESVYQHLSFVKTDLLQENGWAEALDGADAVMHVATKIVDAEPKNPDSVIRPAVTGTLNILKAARTAGIKRCVLTSSIATIGYGQGHTHGVRTYTEDNWTDLANMPWSWAYCSGKTQAEKQAWAFAKDNELDLTTIHPGMILGPTLSAEPGVSLGLVSGLLNGKHRAIPNIGFSISDARDVADMHIAALESDEAINQRYLCTASYLKYPEIADMLRKAYPDAPVTKRVLPDWLMRFLVHWQPSIRQIINDVGNEKHFDGAKGRALLGRDYRSAEETVLDSAKMLVALGLVPGVR